MDHRKTRTRLIALGLGLCLYLLGFVVIWFSEVSENYWFAEAWPFGETTRRIVLAAFLPLAWLTGASFPAW